MGTIVDFVGKVLELIVEPIARQCGYVFSYRSNVDGLKKQVEKLKTAKEAVQHSVQAATRNGEEIEANVRDWLGRVDEMIGEDEKFCQEESRANTGCSYRSCPNLWLRHQISRKAKKMVAEVDQLTGEGSFDRVSFQTLPRLTGPSSMGKEEFESRISKLKEIMEALADPAVYMIGLHGLGGVGKTTLSKQVAKKAEDEKLFEMVVWVEVKHRPLKEVQSQIAYKLGLQLENDNEIISADRLRKRLEHEKSLLVLLDDLWGRLDLDQVGIPFAEGGNKHCKIMLTSRNEDVLTSQMNCKRNIKLELLSEDEALRLFMEKSELRADKDELLLSIAVEVARECAGLPVAIVTVARALRNDKNPTRWSDALRQLKRRTFRNIPGVEDQVYSCIKLSYDSLKTKELKSTFLLSAKLSQVPNISDMLMCSVGLGFLEGVRNMKEAHERMDTLVNYLKASNLLLDGYSENYFTIHDVVRDVALIIASEEQHALIKRVDEKVEWDEDQLENCTEICLHGSDIVNELQEVLYAPKVEFFLLSSKDSDLRIPSSFFNGMQKLKVLNLENVVFSSSSLSVSFLEKLTVLSLDSCTLENIIGVEHLKKLKILNLSGSAIKQLPCEVGHLISLQILNLSHCSQLKEIPPNVLSNLKKLEELYVTGSFNQWEGEGLHEGKKRASLVELQNLPELSTLEIDIPNASMLPKDLFLKNSLERYRICIGTSQGHYSGRKSSKKLTLVLDNINMEYGIFRLLETVEDLYLQNLSGITNLCQFQKPFCELKAINVRSCHQLKSLFSITKAETLSRIEEIKVSECESMEDIVALLDKENVEKGSTMSTIEFPQLRLLELDNLPGLTEFCFSNKAFPKLERLRLIGRQAEMMLKGKFPQYHFPNVKYLYLSGIFDKVATFPYDLFDGFPNLEELEVHYSSFEVIFSWSGLGVAFHQDARSVAPLKKLILDSLRRLKHVWDEKCQLDVVLKNLVTFQVSDCSRLITLGPSCVSLDNLTKLHVDGCHGLINLLTLSTAKTLVQLKRLSIMNCKKIEEIITKGEEGVEAEIVFMKLERLKLGNLSSCKSFCCHNCTLNFPSLSEVVIHVCPKLRLFCSGSLSTPLLKGVYWSLSTPLLKEILWQDNLNKTIQELHHGLEINEYPELINILSGKLAIPDHSFRNMTELIVDKCPFLYDHAIPSYVLTSFINLKKLEVSNCDSVEVVFDLDGINIDKEAHILQAIPLRILNLRHLPKLKYIWKKDPSINCFQHLREMFAYECENLTSIFPKSIAKGLTKLDWLWIESCGIEVIVTEDQTPAPTIDFVFPKLRGLYLLNLPNLRNFYPQRHSVEWPCLHFLKVRYCNKLKLFSWELAKKTEENAEDGIGNQYPLVLFEKVVPKLQTLALNQNDIKMIRNGQFQNHLFDNVWELYLDSLDDDESIVFPYTLLERFPRIEQLHVDHGSFEDIFPGQGTCGDPSIEVPELRYLNLAHLDRLRNIWNEDSQIHASLQKLMWLDVQHCSKLINLAPSSASFDNLHRLKVFGCHCLRHLLTISTVKSLVGLRRLEIEDCKLMEEIVKCESEDVEYIIALKELKNVKLVDLPVLESFCTQTYTFKFPSLTDVNIRGCPKMKMFCPGVLDTPSLEAVEVGENEERWEGNLNKTLEQFSEEECKNSMEG